MASDDDERGHYTKVAVRLDENNLPSIIKYRTNVDSLTIENAIDDIGRQQAPILVEPTSAPNFQVTVKHLVNRQIVWSRPLEVNMHHTLYDIAATIEKVFRMKIDRQWFFIPDAKSSNADKEILHPEDSEDAVKTVQSVSLENMFTGTVFLPML